MATQDKPRREPGICRECGRPDVDLDYCQATFRQLCPRCWAKVDPRGVGSRDPEVIKGETKALAAWARQAG